MNIDKVVFNSYLRFKQANDDDRSTDYLTPTLIAGGLGAGGYGLYKHLNKQNITNNEPVVENIQTPAIEHVVGKSTNKFRRYIPLTLGLTGGLGIGGYGLYKSVNNKSQLNKTLPITGNTVNSKGNTYRNPEIINPLDEYFNKLSSYHQQAQARKMMLHLRLPIATIRQIEQRYPAMDVMTLNFPHTGLELANNLDDVNQYMVNKLTEVGETIPSEHMEDHNKLLNQYKQHITQKAKDDVLTHMKQYVHESELPKWEEFFHQPAISTI